MLTEAVRRFGSALESVRLDTAPTGCTGWARETHANPGDAFSRRPGPAAARRAGAVRFGPGHYRDGLRRATCWTHWARYTKITVGDGFDIEKIRAWRTQRPGGFH